MDLTAALLDLSKSSPRPIIAIDGPAGGGKTTLAGHLMASLSLKYKCVVLHMDDLYNGWEGAFDRHLTDALTGACDSHQKSKRYSLSFYNWSAGRYEAAQEIPEAELLILEGVGSSQEAIRPFLTASIWIDIDPSVGFQRVIARDGEAISPAMARWLVQQDEHFEVNRSRQSADFELTTS